MALEYTLDELIRKCAKRDPSAQKILYEMFSKKVMATCLRYVNSRFEADDVFQETFIKIFNNIDQFSNKGSLEGWMRRIAANTALKYIQKESLNFRNEDIESLLETKSPCDSPIDIVSSQELLNVINNLP